MSMAAASPDQNGWFPASAPRRDTRNVLAHGARLVAGFGLLTVADAGWAHAIDVISLFGLMALGFVASPPDEIAKDDPGGSPAGPDAA